MEKPTIEEALEIVSLKAKADEAYNLLKEKTSAFANKYGEGKFTYKAPEGDGYFYLKLEDNAKKFERGETVFKAASVSKFNLSIETLKNKPKDFQE
jgi:hypothetical protein